MAYGRSSMDCSISIVIFVKVMVMKFYKNIVNVAWITLITITFLAWLIVEEMNLGLWGTFAIIILSALKVNIVSRVFMEVKTAALPAYAIFFKAWIFAVVIIFFSFFAYQRGL